MHLSKYFTKTGTCVFSSHKLRHRVASGHLEKNVGRFQFSQELHSHFKIKAFQAFFLLIHSDVPPLSGQIDPQ